MTRSSLAHIALHASARDVIGDGVDTVRRLAGTEVGYAVVPCGPSVYQPVALDTLTDPRWAQQRLLPGRGLGGKALAEARPCFTADYLEDSTFTGDYRVLVRAEGLRSLSCVPVGGPRGFAALLFFGERRVAAPGDRQIDLMMRVADLVEVGLTLVARREAQLTDPATSVPLTPRERDVLRLLCEGASNRRIASELSIAEPTVKGHVRALIDKYGASSRLDVVVRARGTNDL